MITQLVVRLLQRTGRFDARGFGSADELLRELHDAPGTVDLLITDYQMPGMNGSELAREVRSRCPHARIILMSGKPAYLATHTPQEAGVDAFLPKPFTFRDIEAAIGAVMSGGDPDYRENSRARMLAAVF